MVISAVALLLAARLASAHFAVDYPSWRADSLKNESYNQYVWPCAGVPANAGNRTDWPLTGGSLKLDLHHPWTYVFVNLGLGDNATNFNYTLTESLWNVTGKGTLCVPTMALPADLNVTDGTKASIQVVTLGESGNALYNCADITFRSSAAPLNSSECATSDGLSVSVVPDQTNGTTTSGGNGSGSGGDDSSGDSDNDGDDSTTGSGGSGTSAGSATGINRTALGSVLGLTLAFVFALSV